MLMNFEGTAATTANTAIKRKTTGDTRVKKKKLNHTI